MQNAPEGIAKKLAAEFPKEAISWRAQTVTSDGTKALALAYIDARDVMERLDSVCGVSGWQCEYPHANGKTICSIGVKIDSEWIWKADGAGDTDIEAEKGAISDAFKRAGVKWGIGRYLYALDAVWVPCESYEASDGKGGKKWKWKSFTADPWKYVKAAPVKKEIYDTSAAMRKKFEEIKEEILRQDEHKLLQTVWKENNSHILAMKAIDQTFYDDLVRIKDDQKKVITDIQATKASYSQGFNDVRG